MLQVAVLVAVVALKDVFSHLGDQLWWPAGGRHGAPLPRRPVAYRRRDPITSLPFDSATPPAHNNAAPPPA